MEHTQELEEELVFKDLASLQHIKDLIDSGKVHYSKEALVVTPAKVGSSAGSAIPVYAGGSCESGSQVQHERLFEQVSVGICCCPFGSSLIPALRHDADQLLPPTISVVFCRTAVNFM